MDRLSDLKSAIDGIVEAAAAHEQALGSQESAVRRASDAAIEALANTKGLSAEERLRYLAIIEVAKQVDDLTAKQKSLNEQTAAGVTATGEAKEAEAQIIIVKSGAATAIQHEINEKVKLLRSLAEEKTAHDQLATSVKQVIAVHEQGRIVYTNVGEAAKGAATQIEQLKNTTAASAEVIAARLKSLGDPLPGVTGQFESLNEMADTLAGTLRSVAEGIDAVTSASARATAGQ